LLLTFESTMAAAMATVEFAKVMASDAELPELLSACGAVDIVQTERDGRNLVSGRLRAPWSTAYRLCRGLHNATLGVLA